MLIKSSLAAPLRNSAYSMEDSFSKRDREDPARLLKTHLWKPIKHHLLVRVSRAKGIRWQINWTSLV